jgi:hypothetical protein
MLPLQLRSKLVAGERVALQFAVFNWEAKWSS